MSRLRSHRSDGPDGKAPAPPGPLAAAALVAERELLTRLRDRTFLVSLVATLVLVAAAFALPALVAGDPGEYRVATSGPVSEEIVATLGDDEDAAITVEAVPATDAAAAEDLVRAGDADAAVVDTGSGPVPVETVGDRSVPAELAAAVDRVLTDRAVAEALAGLGADDAAVADALRPVEAEQRLLDPDTASGAALVLELAFAAVFFFAALMFGWAIAQSVTEEKQQRIVELLVAAVPVRSVLLGKIAGNVALALGQVVLLGAVGLLVGSALGEGDVVPLLAGSAGWFVVFFLLGFVMLSCLWAVAGSLANRSEDLSATTLPIQTLVIIPFLLGVSVQDGPWRVALSYVPFSSPVVMPQRLVSGEAAWWEAVASAGLLAVTAALLVVLAERLYRGSLMQTRGRVSLGRAWAGARE
ncbi:MAG: ABC transporter permease [Kineosporiaceae bacterium]